jgi:hypothetical protein
MDYKISLNKEIQEWRKLCYEQSDRIQYYSYIGMKLMYVTVILFEERIDREITQIE